MQQDAIDRMIELSRIEQLTCTCAECGKTMLFVNTQKRYNASGYFERVCSDSRQCEATTARLFGVARC